MSRENLKDAVFGLLRKEGRLEDADIAKPPRIQIAIEARDLTPALLLYFGDKLKALTVFFFMAGALYLSGEGQSASLSAGMCIFLAFQFGTIIYQSVSGIPRMDPKLRRFQLGWSIEGLSIEYQDIRHEYLCMPWLLVRSCKESGERFLIVLRLLIPDRSFNWSRLVIVPKRSFPSAEMMESFRSTLQRRPAQALRDFHFSRPKQSRKSFLHDYFEGFFLVGFGVSIFLILAADEIYKLLTGHPANLQQNSEFVVMFFLVVSAISAFVWKKIKPISDHEVFEANS